VVVVSVTELWFRFLSAMTGQTGRTGGAMF
jgi:hypothetical protein